MNSFPIRLAALALLSTSVLRADLTNGLIAYYNFEQTGEPGIANQVDSGSTHNGSYGNATTYGITPAIAGSGAGFAGNAAYEGALATTSTDRSTLLVGNALNIAKAGPGIADGSGWFNVSTLSAATLGSNFAISAWFFLAPDVDTTGTSTDLQRDYVFESADLDNFDVSFGTNSAEGTTYVSWIGSTSGAQNAGTLAAGQWHHVVHVFSESGANTTLSVYINGIKVGATVSTASSNMNFTSLNFGAARLGRRVFDGMLDEVAVWNRPLSENEVIETFERGQAAIALTSDLASAGKAFVSVETSDPSMGLALGSGLYDISETAFIDAIPLLGHKFTGWNSPFEAEPASFDLVVAESVTLTAAFSQDTDDPDNDGLSNYQELVVHNTLPDFADTDDDGINDGDEVLQSLSDPLVSQRDAVDWIIANLGGGGGGTNPGDIVLTRSPSTDTLTFVLQLDDSTTLGPWAPLSPTTPGVNAAVANDLIEIEVPANSETKRFFRVEGVAP